MHVTKSIISRPKSYPTKAHASSTPQGLKQCCSPRHQNMRQHMDLQVLFFRDEYVGRIQLQRTSETASRTLCQPRYNFQSNRDLDLSNRTLAAYKQNLACAAVSSGCEVPNLQKALRNMQVIRSDKLSMARPRQRSETFSNSIGHFAPSRRTRDTFYDESAEFV